MLESPHEMDNLSGETYKWSIEVYETPHEVDNLSDEMH
jgi:hypothetical protein